MSRLSEEDLCLLDELEKTIPEFLDYFKVSVMLNNFDKVEDCIRGLAYGSLDEESKLTANSTLNTYSDVKKAYDILVDLKMSELQQKPKLIAEACKLVAKSIAGIYALDQMYYFYYAKIHVNTNLQSIAAQLVDERVGFQQLCSNQQTKLF